MAAIQRIAMPGFISAARNTTLQERAEMERAALRESWTYHYGAPPPDDDAIEGEFVVVDEKRLPPPDNRSR